MLTFETNCGSFTVTLDPEVAPKTTARSSRWRRTVLDDTIFHRVAPARHPGGDLTKSGSGGPPFDGRRLSDGTRRRRRAKAGTRRGTAGSQFFVVTGETRRRPYAIVGEVTNG